jgi:outer membrane lipoprotein-sorting protein
MLYLYDGASTERVTVADSYTFGSTTVPLTSALVYAHTAGVSVSNLPAAIKEATILMTTAYLKIRGDASMTMAITNTATQQSPGTGSGRIGTEVGHVQDLLKPFRRIR